jgi:hypothetical protein
VRVSEGLLSLPLLCLSVGRGSARRLEHTFQDLAAATPSMLATPTEEQLANIADTPMPDPEGPAPDDATAESESHGATSTDSSGGTASDEGPGAESPGPEGGVGDTNSSCSSGDAPSGEAGGSNTSSRADGAGGDGDGGGGGDRD